MVILDSTAKSLIAYMAGSHTTTQPTFVTGWLDTDGITDIEGSTDGNLNDTNQVVLCAAPASGHRRIIKAITIYNGDTVSQTVTVAILSSGNVRPVLTPTVLGTLNALVIGGDLAEYIVLYNQGLNTTDSPTFANITDSGLTASRIILTDANKKLIVNGTLTTNRLPKAVSSGASLTDSIISDDGSSATIGSLAGFLIGTAGVISAIDYVPWTTPAYNAGNFTGRGAMTWTVSSGNVITYQYMIIGKMMFAAFSISASSVGGTLNTSLNIAIPASKTAATDIYTTSFCYQNGWNLGETTVANGSNIIQVYIAVGESTNWAASAGGTYVRGSIAFPIN